jgi:hypothetical protein
MLADYTRNECIDFFKGIQLLSIMLKERKFTARPALKLLSYALNSIPENCDAFVQNGGLGPLFSLFMRRNTLSKKVGEQIEDDEYVLSIMQNLSRWCSVGDCQGKIFRFL